MERTPEPEIMDDAAQAEAYAQADFSASDAAFAEAFLSEFGRSFAGEIVDLGCGPGNIAQELLARIERCRVLGVDGSAAMLAIARERCAGDARVRFLERILPADDLPEQAFDAVVSNSLLHHLHEPQVLWRSVRRLGRPGAAVFVGDLRRPATPRAARELVDTYAADAPAVLRQDFLASLHAAFEPGEVESQLASSGLSGLEVRAVGDRHLYVAGRLAA